MKRIDFDGNGFDDVEALRSDGTSDIYIGTSSGLVPVGNFAGWPTADERDGKFALVTGRGFATLDQPSRLRRHS